ncbi:MAG: DeoR/GlpR transcriptional regulator [Proteobacteria bacterium]|nr:DeoR/GlpR transcriptional regulator [Pseudomonadota bacterium]
MSEVSLGNQRQMKIISLLAENDAMRVTDLSSILNVTSVTIRRDLESLEEQKRIKKYHGSVSLIKPDNPYAKFLVQLEHNRAEKNGIAKAAASLIKPKSVVSIDSGSTTYLIANHLPPDYSTKIITNCLMAALKFSENPDSEVIQVGGIVHSDTSSSVDYLATDFLKKFNTDIAFMTSTSFNLPQGAFDSIVSLINAKRSFIDITKRVVLLLDSSKFKQQSMCLSVPIETIDTIITDEKAPKDIVEQIVDLGKELVVVETVTGSIVSHHNR